MWFCRCACPPEDAAGVTAVAGANLGNGKQEDHENWRKTASEPMQPRSLAISEEGSVGSNPHPIFALTRSRESAPKQTTSDSPGSTHAPITQVSIVQLKVPPPSGGEASSSQVVFSSAVSHPVVIISSPALARDAHTREAASTGVRPAASPARVVSPRRTGMLDVGETRDGTASTSTRRRRTQDERCATGGGDTGADGRREPTQFDGKGVAAAVPASRGCSGGHTTGGRSRVAKVAPSSVSGTPGGTAALSWAREEGCDDDEECMSPTEADAPGLLEYRKLLKRIREPVSHKAEAVFHSRGGYDLYTGDVRSAIDSPQVDHILECQVVAHAVKDNPATYALLSDTWFVNSLRPIVNDDSNLNVTHRGINISKGTYVKSFLARMGTPAEMSLLYFFTEYGIGREKKIYECAAQVCNVIARTGPSLAESVRCARRDDGHVGKLSAFGDTADTLDEIISIMDVDLGMGGTEGMSEGGIARRSRLQLNKHRPRITYKLKR